MTAPLYDITARLREVLHVLKVLLSDIENEIDRQESDKVQEVDSANTD
jgi:hypothetical protein